MIAVFKTAVNLMNFLILRILFLRFLFL